MPSKPKPKTTIQQSRQVKECERELKTFVKGGLPGLEVLGRVYTQIFKHFGIKEGAEKYRLLRAAGVYLDENKKRLKLISPENGALSPSYSDISWD